ncbi:hypothetical protein JCM30237_12870 [Halolamina litorea]|uniref:DUF6339 family protein n=1 Tax=Halolamina litorea TaxID=1515593 RepID=A0ABD6BMT5_9EURY|nr:DUF6339 family protein [Halolamina litorea]
MSTEPIKRLTDEGYNKVQSKIRAGAYDEFPLDGISKHVREDVDGTVDTDLLDRRIEAVREHVDFGSQSGGTIADSAVAPTIRLAVDIPDRVAAMPGVWHYLASVKYPDFVRDRWGDNEDIEEKFLGAGRNPYTNALGRLWWGAELTKVPYDAAPEDADLTNAHRLYNKQRLANFVLDRSFRRYRYASAVCAEELYRSHNDVISETTTRFKKALTMYQLEDRSREDLERQIRRIREDEEAKREA